MYSARRFVWMFSVAGTVAIGMVDYSSGAELRVFPLYFLPVSYGAWYRGRAGAIILPALGAVTWAASNYAAGMVFSHWGIWLANTLVQGASFAVVGWLIAALRAALGRARDASRTDPLTGLLNTRAFYDDAGRALALCRRKGRPVTIAYVDLDGFKAVNDRYGHTGGDDVLRVIASTLFRATRPSDLLARVGGDEFVLLLPETDAPAAQAALDRLRAVLAEATRRDARVVTCSVGAVTFRAVPAAIEAMVQQADERMFAAKAAGKDCARLEVVEEPSLAT